MLSLQFARCSWSGTLVLAGLLSALVGCHDGGAGDGLPIDSSARVAPGGPGVARVAPGGPGVLPDLRLRFRSQPDDGLAGLRFGQTIVVEVLDASGAVVNAAIPVEMKVQDPNGKAKIGGTLVVTSRAGVATFSDLRVTASGRDLRLFACSIAATSTVSNKFTRDVSAGKRHVILLVADGWGYKQIEATRNYTGVAAPYEALNSAAMTTWDQDVALVNGPTPYDPNLAWSNMYYLVWAVTDSASAATALYSGVKTNAGRIGIGPGVGGEPTVSVGELALRNGMGSGVVTSVPVSHATPAAWAAHNDSRVNYPSLTDEMLFGDPTATSTGFGGHGTTDVLSHVVIGGGHPDFSGGFYVSPGQLAKAKKESGNPNGWQVAEKVVGQSGAANLFKVSGNTKTERMFGLFGSISGNIPFRLHDGSGLTPEDPTLAEMAESALQVLSRQPKGFCLMVEGGAVDWAGHFNNMSQSLGEMIAFGEMVGSVIDWVEDPTNGSNWANTLLVVTGDHECGLLTAGPMLFPDIPLGRINDQTIAAERFDTRTGMVGSWDDTNGDQMMDIDEVIHWTWNTFGHSNSLIPCYFKGLESGRFAALVDGTDPKRGRYIDNTDVFEVMLRVLKR